MQTGRIYGDVPIGSSHLSPDGLISGPTPQLVTGAKALEMSEAVHYSSSDEELDGEYEVLRRRSADRHPTEPPNWQPKQYSTGVRHYGPIPVSASVPANLAKQGSASPLIAPHSEGAPRYVHRSSADSDNEVFNALPGARAGLKRGRDMDAFGSDDDSHFGESSQRPAGLKATAHPSPPHKPYGHVGQPSSFQQANPKPTPSTTRPPRPAQRQRASSVVTGMTDDSEYGTGTSAGHTSPPAPGAKSKGAAKAQKTFNMLEVVWARVEGFPWWPAQVQEPMEKKHMKLRKGKNDFFVVYYGTGEVGWVAATKMSKWEHGYNKKTSIKNPQLQHAINEAWAYIGKQRPDAPPCPVQPGVP